MRGRDGLDFDGLELPPLTSCWTGRKSVGTLGARTVDIVFADRPADAVTVGCEDALTLREVAEELGLHESTISRATTRKYLRTPRGTFEFKYFFSSGIATDSGGGASATAIQAMIKRLVDAENPRAPLSDAKLADLLKAEGVPVARRTVAKYREAMNIASSQERQRL